MKVTVEVECSPDEARQFFGLPDVKPLQAALMARLEKQTLDAAAAMSPEAVLRAWMPFFPQGQEQFRDMFASMFRPFLPSETKPTGGSETKPTG